MGLLKVMFIMSVCVVCTRLVIYYICPFCALFCITWFLIIQVEAGADITAVDRFGNHVEALNMSSTGKLLTTTGSGSKLGDVSDEHKTYIYIYYFTKYRGGMRTLFFVQLFFSIFFFKKNAADHSSGRQ